MPPTHRSSYLKLNSFLVEVVGKDLKMVVALINSFHLLFVDRFQILNHNRIHTFFFVVFPSADKKKKIFACILPLPE